MRLVNRRETQHRPSSISHKSLYCGLAISGTRPYASWLLALGLSLTGFGGAFAPWIGQEGVALQLTGPGLAEFIKFLPEIRTLQIQIQRLYFLFPLFLALVALPLFIENNKVILPVWLRRLLRLAVIPPALASLSPVWTPAILIAPEFRLQTIGAAMAIGLTLGASLLKSLPLRPLVILLFGGGVAAIVLPIWHFTLIQPAMSAIYNEPVRLGWGWHLTVTGIVLSLIAGLWLVFDQQQNGRIRSQDDEQSTVHQ